MAPHDPPRQIRFIDRMREDYDDLKVELAMERLKRDMVDPEKPEPIQQLAARLFIQLCHLKGERSPR